MTPMVLWFLQTTTVMQPWKMADSYTDFCSSPQGTSHTLSRTHIQPRFTGVLIVKRPHCTSATSKTVDMPKPKGHPSLVIIMPCLVSPTNRKQSGLTADESNAKPRFAMLTSHKRWQANYRWGGTNVLTMGHVTSFSRTKPHGISEIFQVKLNANSCRQDVC